jgi:acetolactate synthase-1/2/3 large subunit
MHQEREFPGRVVATDLRNPDFAALAAAPAPGPPP